jgi:hypothetical protein
MEKENLRMLNIAFIVTVDIIKYSIPVHVIVFCETWYSLIVVDGAYIEKSQVYFKSSEGVKNYYHRHFRFSIRPHCTEKTIYVFPEMKLCDLVPNSYIHVLYL